MRYKIFSTLALAMLCLLCSSCSWVTRFVIVNKSNERLEVRYTLMPLSGGTENLEKTTLDEKGEIKTGGWLNVPPEQYEYNRETETVTVRLEPNEALAVAAIGTYTGHSAGSGFFKIKTLNLSGTRGAAYYEGRQALTQFRKQSESLYTIVYE